MSQRKTKRGKGTARMVRVAAMSQAEFAIFLRGNAAFVHPVRVADRKDWILYAKERK